MPVQFSSVTLLCSLRALTLTLMLTVASFRKWRRNRTKSKLPTYPGSFLRLSCTQELCAVCVINELHAPIHMHRINLTSITLQFSEYHDGSLICTANKNKKFELMLTRRAKAYSNSCSHFVAIHSWRVHCSPRSQKSINPLFWKFRIFQSHRCWYDWKARH